jgi:hypothetical protein
MSARLTQRVASLSLVGLLSVAALTGCGSSTSSSTGSGPPQGFGSGGPGGGFSQDPALLKKIQKCLKAAGISSTFPQGGPSGFPSGTPSGSPPSGFPSGGPSGGPGGGFSDPQVQSALKACGITLNRPSGAPSGAPSS